MSLARAKGFEPVCDENSRLLILGSFPSVKSREIEFYYGNKRNRFWGMLCGFFGEEIPSTTEGKRAFLLEKGIALWDVAVSCEIKGSADESIQKVELADLKGLLAKTKIEKILLNGGTAYKLFFEVYGDLEVPYRKMQSTSPRNPRFQKEEWENALKEIFKTN